MAARRKRAEPTPAPPPAALARVTPHDLAAWNEQWSAHTAWTPLEVTATLRGPIAIPNGPIALDALLGAVVAKRNELIASMQTELYPIAIPVEYDSDGHFYLASFGACEIEIHEHRWTNRRFPIAEAQVMGEAKLRTIRINGGPCKSFRLPLDTVHLVDDRMTWWCMGDADAIRDLLTGARYLGKKRGIGLGAVKRWDVRPCEPWSGFPVARDGQPLRTLPINWPTLSGGAEQAYRCLEPPYWRRDAEELCAVPEWTP